MTLEIRPKHEFFICGQDIRIAIDEVYKKILEDIERELGLDEDRTEGSGREKSENKEAHE